MPLCPCRRRGEPVALPEPEEEEPAFEDVVAAEQPTPEEEPDLPSLASLIASAPQTLQILGGYSPAERAERARKAGVEAAKVLAGRKRFPARSVPLTPNSWYVILRAPDSRSCVVRTYTAYSRIVKIDGWFVQGTVSHAFPDELEAQIYARAAGWRTMPVTEV